MTIQVFTPDNFTLADLIDSEADYNICWDLDTTIAPALEGLNDRQAKKLEENHKCYYPPYNVFYVPGIVFSANPLYWIPKLPFLYGINQYYPEANVKDEDTIAKCGERLIQALNSMGLYPTKLTSPAGIYEECVLSKLNLPTVYDVPREAGEYAWYAGGKLWIQTYKKSKKPSWYYDLSSSFPTVAKDLIDIRRGEWVKRKNWDFLDHYGYARCKVQMYDDVKVSPIIYVDAEDNQSNPTGTWETYLTPNEMRFIREWKIGIVEIVDGWWFTPKQIFRPLEKPIERLLAYKQSDDELVRRLAKAMSVGGIYGKFGEEWNYKFAPYFNPCYFAEISTQVRLKVAQFIYENKLQDNVIEVRVDGVRVDREVEGVSGEWRLKE